MRRLGLERELVDAGVYERTVGRFRDAGIVLPTFGQLADPTTNSEKVRVALGSVGPDDAHPLNLFRVHWYNGADRRPQGGPPQHLGRPAQPPRVHAKGVLALGDRFPRINAPKVLGAYWCLVPPGITCQFESTR